MKLPTTNLWKWSERSRKRSSGNEVEVNQAAQSFPPYCYSNNGQFYFDSTDWTQRAWMKLGWRPRKIAMFKALHLAVRNKVLCIPLIHVLLHLSYSKNRKTPRDESLASSTMWYNATTNKAQWTPDISNHICLTSKQHEVSKVTEQNQTDCVISTLPYTCCSGTLMRHTAFLFK